MLHQAIKAKTDSRSFGVRTRSLRDDRCSRGRQCLPWQGMSELRLLPFEREQLREVEPWFDDPDTERWLGGPGWPRLVLDLADRPLGEHRGAIETGHYGWSAWDRDELVGYIDCGTTDRWTTWEGGPNARGVVATLLVPSGNLAYVVDPAVRRQGYGTAMISALLRIPSLAHIELFAAGVEPDNVGSVECLRAAGFEALDSQPDWEGIVYYVKERLE
jgi:RimJ/RimL family protein N-acetyltransferase